MGTGSSRPERRESQSATDTKAADESDVASSSDWSVEGQTDDRKTEVPATKVITTEVPTTVFRTTEIPATEDVTTEVPATKVHTTEILTTHLRTTEVPATEDVATEIPATKVPTTEVLMTHVRTTDVLTTEVPTAVGNTAAPTQSKQQENTTQKTETEEERKRREKREKQERAYKEIRVDDVWLKVDETVERNPPALEQQTQRTGWHTVRIFVSSTFRDFHTERDVLVKKVIHSQVK